MIIKVKNKGILSLALIGIIFFLAYLNIVGTISELSGEGEITLILIILWALSLFIKLEVKEC